MEEDFRSLTKTYKAELKKAGQNTVRPCYVCILIDNSISQFIPAITSQFSSF